MAKIYIVGGKIHFETGERTVISGTKIVQETTAAAVSGRIMSSMAASGGLAGKGGLAGAGGGLAG